MFSQSNLNIVIIMFLTVLIKFVDLNSMSSMLMLTCKNMAYT